MITTQNKTHKEPKSKAVIMLQQIKDKCGIKLNSLAHDSGMSEGMLYVSMHKNRRSARRKISRVDQILSTLRRRAKLLQSARLKRPEDVESLISECGLNKTFLAKKMDISHQAFSESLILGMSENKLADVEDVLHSVGENLEKIISHYKEVK